MLPLKDEGTDLIVEFIEDEVFLDIKRRKAQLNKGTIALFILASLSLISYIATLFIGRYSVPWFDFAITIAVISIYFSAAVYSRYKPFASFVAVIIILSIFLLIWVFQNQDINFIVLMVRISLIVYFSTLLKSAKLVQQFESKN